MADSRRKTGHKDNISWSDSVWGRASAGSSAGLQQPLCCRAWQSFLLLFKGGRSSATTKTERANGVTCPPADCSGKHSHQQVPFAKYATSSAKTSGNRPGLLANCNKLIVLNTWFWSTVTHQPKKCLRCCFWYFQLQLYRPKPTILF